MACGTQRRCSPPALRPDGDGPHQATEHPEDPCLGFAGGEGVAPKECTGPQRNGGMSIWIGMALHAKPPEGSDPVWRPGKGGREITPKTVNKSFVVGVFWGFSFEVKGQNHFGAKLELFGIPIWLL